MEESRSIVLLLQLTSEGPVCFSMSQKDEEMGPGHTAQVRVYWNFPSLLQNPHLTLRHPGRSLEFITLSEDSRSNAMLLQWHFCGIILQKSRRREIMKNYLIQVLWLNTQLYSNLHSWAEALILRRAETEVCCNLEAAEMPAGSEGTVLAPPTNRSAGWPQSHHLCTLGDPLCSFLAQRVGVGT